MSRDNFKGFTIVELMLAMTFLGLLLLAIALTTIQISNIYTKGITLREVNQAGRTLSDELQRTIAAASTFDVTPKSGDLPATSRYVKWDGGGRLCLGRYTYAWNYGKALAGEEEAFNKYNDTNEPVRFVKVDDPSGGLCAAPANAIPHDKAVESLSQGDRDLVLHAFDITQTQADANSGQAVYAITFVVGTNDRQQLTANDASCKPPSEGVGNENYCSVNQFDLIARTGNASEGNE